MTILSLAATLSVLVAPSTADSTPLTPASAVTAEIPVVRVAPSALGRSGALRVTFVNPGEIVPLPLVWSGAPRPASVGYRWVSLDGRAPGGLLGETLTPEGARAPLRAGAWRLQLQEGSWSQELRELTVITRHPFEVKAGGYVNGYHMGSWSTEGEVRDDRYAPPAGFIEVTPENQDLQISEHFRLRNFLTKNQFSVWPKYVALDLRLIDKLELVVQELNAMGARAQRVTVMSGFRTPAYNGPGEGGRARLSRHTYGDASDVWIDDDVDGYMDDLNQDGFRDTRDADVMLRAVERVEARHPELIGGAGTYPDNGAHGPFIHIDTRGNRARW